MQAGPGQPRTANLRRATSTAYYAAFHAMALAVADVALPNAPQREQWGAARYVTHTAIKQVCGWVAGAAPPRHLLETVIRLRRDATLSRDCNVFLGLLLNREAADYDHSADVTRANALADVRDATSLVDHLEARPRSTATAGLLGLIALRTSIR